MSRKTNREKNLEALRTRMTLRYEETGEVRPPSRGEWFRGVSGVPQQAQFDFRVQSFPILREVVEEEK